MIYSLLACALLGQVAAQHLNTFQNPILPGFHPDPSCIHVPEDETFYCASSSFNVFPGIPIYASQDLTTWKLVGHVLNRRGQLPDIATSIGSTSGIWAPTFRHHNGTYYLITTLVHDKRPEADPSRWDNIIFTTTDLWKGEWSDAVHFKFQGYDPSPVWDEQGNSYIVGAHAYRVSPGIHLAKVDLKTGELKSNFTNVWNGTGGLAPEGPHIYRKDGYYYLLAAEGGTGKDHMVTFARSKSLYGPYENNPQNPVLTNANTTNYFQATGHADLFQDKRGNWWSVALAVRAGPDFVTFPMGRETVLTNVTWTNGSWPLFNNPIQGRMRGWQLPRNTRKLPGTGHIATDGDDDLQFRPKSKIPSHFIYWRPPIQESYTISPPGHPNTLRLTPSKLNLTGLDGNSGGPGGQTFIGRRQVDTFFSYYVDFDFKPRVLEEEAGITLFLSQNHHARLGIALLPSNSTTPPTLTPHFRFHAISYIPVPASFVVPVPVAWHNKPITLELETLNTTHYAFSANLAGSSARPRRLAIVPGEIISWGFTGAIVGAYATANGGNGTAPAYVSNWNYEGWGQVRETWEDVTPP
ncbi:xylosidase : arab-like proteininofuranosidase [Dendryphion nanum]|uniref:Xylosidase: arab-like proteininofuranosidase n=1 Tax=Dendryphion nanum TaxID=256645 RepID=A0A9P9EED2_9PLEO|nr:xylosidase : arab-like proteininofuranosidase [Dendryphion nanum]